jgi:hypothetical protein
MNQLVTRDPRARTALGEFLASEQAGEFLSFGNESHITGDCVGLSMLYIPSGNRPGLEARTFAHPDFNIRSAFYERYWAVIGSHQDRLASADNAEAMKVLTKESIEIGIRNALTHRAILIGGFALLETPSAENSRPDLLDVVFARRALSWHWTGIVRQTMMDSEHYGSNGSYVHKDHQAALFGFQEAAQAYWTTAALSMWLPNVGKVRTDLRITPDGKDALSESEKKHAAKLVTPRTATPKHRKRRKK